MLESVTEMVGLVTSVRELETGNEPEGGLLFSKSVPKCSGADGWPTKTFSKSF